MTVWNVYLNRRELPVKVRKILSKKPGLMVIVDSRGKEHQLSEIDFPSFDWEKIQSGSTITLIIKESVMMWRVKPPSIRQSLRRIIAEASKKASAPYFIWVCEYCCVSGYVEYEETDDPQMVAERIRQSHQAKAKPGCEHDAVRIFDHRGMEQKDSALLLSSQKVA